jgi:long-subunit fatty acid transport protein
LLALVLLPKGSAAADPIDTFGFDARAQAMGNAMTAAVQGAGSAFYNPAAGALAEHPTVTIGYSYAAMMLELDGRDAGVTAPRGLSLGLGLPFRCGPECALAFDLGLYLPDQFTARVQTVPASQPHFLLLDNDVDRITVNTTLALRLGWLAVGGGVTLLADVAGNGVDFTIGARGGTQVGEASIDVALPNRAAAVLGLLVSPRPDLRFGVAWRAAIDLHLRLDIIAHVDIPGGGETIVSIRAINFYTPHKLSGGFAWDVTPALTLTADASYYRWSGFRGGVPDLRVLVDLAIAPAILEGVFAADQLSDTLTVRAGGEWRRDLGGDRQLALRAGLAFEPTPVGRQDLVTSFADDDRLILSAGGGLGWQSLGALLTKPVRLDVALQWHHLLSQTTTKLHPALPAFSSGGDILHLALTATASF